jgi:hypothetical protein
MPTHAIRTSLLAAVIILSAGLATAQMPGNSGASAPPPAPAVPEQSPPPGSLSATNAAPLAPAPGGPTAPPDATSSALDYFDGIASG